MEKRPKEEFDNVLEEIYASDSIDFKVKSDSDLNMLWRNL